MLHGAMRRGQMAVPAASLYDGVDLRETYNRPSVDPNTSQGIHHRDEIAIQRCFGTNRVLGGVPKQSHPRARLPGPKSLFGCHVLGKKSEVPHSTARWIVDDPYALPEPRLTGLGARSMDGGWRGHTARAGRPPTKRVQDSRSDHGPGVRRRWCDVHD